MGDEEKLGSAGNELALYLVLALCYQMVPAAGGGALELGGLCFMVVKKSTS